MKILSTSRRSWSVRRISSRTISPASVEPAEQGVGDGLRLLGDLLEHEVVVAALLGGARRPSRCGSPCPRRAAPSKSVISMPSAVISTTWSWPSSTASRVCSMNARHVAGEEVLAVAAADHERRVAPGADHHAGRVGVDGEQGERALQPAADPAHRLGQRCGPSDGAGPRRTAASSAASRCAAHSVSVSLANSTPVGLELGPQLGEVLDDAVVDDRDPAVARTGAGGRCGRSGRRGWPSGCARCRSCRVAMPSAAVAARPSAFSRLASLPARFSVSSVAVADDGDAGRVVAAVLQPPQPVEHDPQRRPGADVSHDSTHGRKLSGTPLILVARKSLNQSSDMRGFGGVTGICLPALGTVRDARPVPRRGRSPAAAFAWSTDDPAAARRHLPRAVAGAAPAGGSDGRISATDGLTGDPAVVSASGTGSAHLQPARTDGRQRRPLHPVTAVRHPTGGR